MKSSEVKVRVPFIVPDESIRIAGGRWYPSEGSSSPALYLGPYRLDGHRTLSFTEWFDVTLLRPYWFFEIKMIAIMLVYQTNHVKFTLLQINYFVSVDRRVSYLR